MARVNTFRDVLAKYESHPEVKSLGPEGRPCDRATVGLPQRRPVRVGTITLIGKESNRLEEREAGELTREEVDQWLTTYEDDDEWYRILVPRLRELGAEHVATSTRMSERRVRDIISGKALPHQAHRNLLNRLEGHS